MTKIKKTKSDDKEKPEYDDLPPTPPKEGHEEEVKEGRGLKILIRLLVLLAQTKTGNNSYKLKNEIRDST